MAEGFNIEVPFDGGGGGMANGEKVTRQVGEKIVGELKKILSAVKVGRGAPEGDSKGLMGVSKGLKGVTAKLGALGVAIAATVGILAKSSPYLKGILDIFGRAFMIFFRPFGDFLATLLRPLALIMMKMAVAWLKWTRSPEAKKVVEIAKDQLSSLFGFGRLGDFGSWLWEKVKSIWKWDFDFGRWLKDKITSIWNWTLDFGSWLWEKVTSIWNWRWDFGKWVWEKVTSIFRGGGDKEVSPSPTSRDHTKGFWNDEGLFRPFSKAWAMPKGSFQMGTPSVQSDGIYQLHKGEQVIPRSRAGQNKSTIFRPTFQISANVTKDIDIDAIVRRAGRMTEMDLKQRGII